MYIYIYLLNVAKKTTCARPRKGEAQGVLSYQKETGIFDNPHLLLFRNFICCNYLFLLLLLDVVPVLFGIKTTGEYIHLTAHPYAPGTPGSLEPNVLTFGTAFQICFLGFGPFKTAWGFGEPKKMWETKQIVTQNCVGKDKWWRFFWGGGWVFFVFGLGSGFWYGFLAEDSPGSVEEINPNLQEKGALPQKTTWVKFP